MEISVNIDRITVVGIIDGSRVERFMNESEMNWVASSSGFVLRRTFDDENFENIAFVGKNQHQSSYRIDTSCHFDNDLEKNEVRNFIELLSDAHFSRLDIAFDIFNSEYKNMGHRLYRTNVSERRYGKGKNVETIYYGANASDVSVRYYDKLRERKSKKKKIDEKIVQWERLEIQLRRNKSYDWIEQVDRMLSEFKMPNLMHIESITERSILSSLENGTVEWNELSKGSAAKYRKMIKDNVGFDDTLSKLLVLEFENNLLKIQNELYQYLSEMKILNEIDYQNTIAQIKKSKS